VFYWEGVVCIIYLDAPVYIWGVQFMYGVSYREGGGSALGSGLSTKTHELELKLDKAEVSERFPNTDISQF
jgi:hypothetical protein